MTPHTSFESRRWDVEEVFIGALLGGWASNTPEFWISPFAGVTLLLMMLSAGALFRVVVTNSSHVFASMAAGLAAAIWTIGALMLRLTGILGLGKTWYLGGFFVMLCIAAARKRFQP